LSLPAQLKVLIEKHEVNLFHSHGISVTALNTMDPVGTPNGNRKVLRLNYNWHRGKEDTSLSSDGGQYLSEYSGHYLLAFSK
jgi:hypothetical protein